MAELKKFETLSINDYSFFKKMGQSRPLFDYFRSFHMTNIEQLL